MEDELLTVGYVAELLKLNQQTVRNVIDRGELPAVRVGRRRIRIELERFLERGSSHTTVADEHRSREQELQPLSTALQGRRARY
jgi:excisionase family DNA binding protein